MNNKKALTLYLVGALGQPEFEYIWLPVAFSKNELQPDQD